MDIKEIIENELNVCMPISGGTGNSVKKSVKIVKQSDTMDFKSVEKKYLDLITKIRNKTWREISNRLETHSNQSLHHVYIYTFENRQHEYIIQKEEYFFDLSDFFRNYQKVRKYEQ